MPYYSSGDLKSRLTSQIFFFPKELKSIFILTRKSQRYGPDFFQTFFLLFDYFFSLVVSLDIAHTWWRTLKKVKRILRTQHNNNAAFFFPAVTITQKKIMTSLHI
jgi:hypothetical protein